jgi:acetyl-CoA carboxylase biotin carboxyl carrier protein
MPKQEPKRNGQAPQGSRVDLKELQRVLAFMAEHNLEELEYQRGEFHVRMRKPSSGGGTHSGQVAGLLPTSAAPPGPSSLSSAQIAASAEELYTLKSPIVGTFYEAPAPGSDPFVKVGDKVKAGQVLCIIEAMKLMNEIEADRAGEVVRRLVENGQPVEYGQGLFAIRPASGE